MTATFYFITHPSVVIDPQLPVPRWPLSERGVMGVMGSGLYLLSDNCKVKA